MLLIPTVNKNFHYFLDIFLGGAICDKIRYKTEASALLIDASLFFSKIIFNY